MRKPSTTFFLWLLRFTVLASATLLCLCASVHAQKTTRIPQDAPTIQSAIDAAADGDTLLVAPGLYRENLNLRGKAITLASTEGPAATLLDGLGLAPVVTFATGETRATTLSGFTLRHGLPGILLTGASPTLAGNILTENRCAALDGTHAAPLLTRNTIDHTQPGPACAAPIVLSGRAPLEAILRDNVVEDNDLSGSTPLSAGIALIDTAAELTGNLLRRNTTTSDAPSALSFTGSTVLLQQNLIHANTSHCGPAVSLDASTTAQLLDNTLAGNITAPDCPQAGPAAELFLASTQVLLANNILASSTPHPALACTGAPPMHHNLLHNATGPALSSTCAAVALFEDPLFADQTNADYHLAPHSPAIEAGTVALGILPSRDLDQKPRTQKGHIDLGVYQHVQPHALAASTTLLTASPNPAEAFQPITLSAQVAASGATPTGSVTFTANAQSLATVLLDPTGHATFTTTLLAAGSALLTATYNGSDAHSASASQLTERIAPATTLLSFAVTPSTADQTQAITLSAAAQAPLSTQLPSGQVQFLALHPPSAPTLLATATLDATGRATATLPAMTTGTWLIDAVYLGSPNFQPVALSPADALTLSIAAHGYVLAAATPAITLQSGHHGPVDLTLKSLGSLAAGVTLACASLPANASCTFSPAAPTLTAGATLPVTMTLETNAVPGFLSLLRPATGPALAGIALLGLTLRRRRRVLLLGLLAAFTGCTSKYPDQVPSGTYTIQVVSQAAGSSLTQTLPITLIVTN